ARGFCSGGWGRWGGGAGAGPRYPALWWWGRGGWGPPERQQPPMLEPTEDDLVINPALNMELSRDRITLPRTQDLAEVTLAELLDAVRAAVAAKFGWLASESAALSYFPPMKEAMYQDLLDHEDLVASHPLVRVLSARGAPG